MKSYALFVTALLSVLTAVHAFAADETALDRLQETVGLPPIADAKVNTAESRAIPDNLQAARKQDESPFSDIKILPSF